MATASAAPAENRRALPVRLEEVGHRFLRRLGDERVVGRDAAPGRLQPLHHLRARDAAVTHGRLGVLEAVRVERVDVRATSSRGDVNRTSCTTPTTSN
jgi:hypothetical protein